MSNSSGPSRIGRPPGADPERTRTDILESALDAFAERGFEGASIREITGRVGVGHNLVRHYFGSKEDLWRAAVHHGLDPLAERLKQLLQPEVGRSPEVALRQGLEIMLTEGGSNRAAIQLLVSEALRGGERFGELFDQIIAPVGLVVLDYVASSGEEFADVDPRVVGLYVFGAVFSPFSFTGLTERLGLRPPEPGAALDQHANELIDLILSGLLSRR